MTRWRCRLSIIMTGTAGQRAGRKELMAARSLQKQKSQKYHSFNTLHALH
jgi:hypothetical protein